MKMQLPAETTVDAEVDLLRDGEEYWVQAHLSVNIHGIDRATAQKIVDAAHQTCPYSKATRGNIDVTIDLV
jgi:Ohr subfamily peroxiredoxin